jgi:hypothetical protein
MRPRGLIPRVILVLFALLLAFGPAGCGSSGSDSDSGSGPDIEPEPPQSQSLQVDYCVFGGGGQFASSENYTTYASVAETGGGEPCDSENYRLYPGFISATSHQNSPR